MRSVSAMISVWFGAVMILLTLAGALVFTFTDYMDERLFGTKRTLFVTMLFAYSIYRGFRLKSALSQRNED